MNTFIFKCVSGKEYYYKSEDDISIKEFIDILSGNDFIIAYDESDKLLVNTKTIESGYPED